MDKKMVNTLLTIASGGLLIAGLIFLIIAIFSDEKSMWTLASALGSILLSNIFNLINMQLKKRNSK